MKKYDSQFGLDQSDESLRTKKSITRGVNQQIDPNAVLALRIGVPTP
jgi:hypothetical protein